jgi:hypothetical protein
MSKPVTNISASVRQRLLNLARDRKEDFGLLLTKETITWPPELDTAMNVAGFEGALAAGL